VTGDIEDVRVIVCNYIVGANYVAEGAKAYLLSQFGGNLPERVKLIVNSRGGRQIEKWESIIRLGNFRWATIPPEHPLAGRLYSCDDGSLEHVVRCAEIMRAKRGAAVTGVRRGRTGGDNTPWVVLEKPKPAKVADVTEHWGGAPPEPSARCLYWLRHIRRGWRPSARVMSEGYHGTAEWFGVYLFEYLQVLCPILVNPAASLPGLFREVADRMDTHAVEVMSSPRFDPDPYGWDHAEIRGARRLAQELRELANNPDDSPTAPKGH